MATNVIPFMQANMPVPAHIAKFLGTNTNIDPKDTVPQLSFRGKVWRIVLEGEETVLTKDEEPVSMVRVVVLDHNKARSRTYYEGSYDPKKPAPPACRSLDGVRPDADVKEPQSPTCAKCPNSIKGSKITDNGNESYACSVYKRIVVVPHADLGFTPLLMKLPQTSMWDGKNEANEAKGWYAWDQYLDMLRTRGYPHTGVVITKIKFDAKVEYPKLLFAAQDFLSAEDFAKVSALLDTDPVTSLLRVSDENVAKRVAAPAADEDDAPAPVAKKKKAAPPPEAADDDDDDDAPAVPAPKKKAAIVVEDDDDGDDPAPAPVAKKKVAAVVEDDDDGDDPDPVPVAKKKAAAPAAPAPAAKKKAAAPPPDDDEEEADPAPAPAAKKKGGNSGLGDLMSQWEEPAE